MEIMTISSLAGLGAVPGTVHTYGDALAYLVDGPGATLNSAVLDAQDRLQNASASGRVSQRAFSTLIDSASNLQQRISALYSAFAAQGHGLVLSAADASALTDLDSRASQFRDSVSSSISGLNLKGWVAVGVGLAAAAGFTIWVTRNLPYYKRRSRRRR